MTKLQNFTSGLLAFVLSHLDYLTIEGKRRFFVTVSDGRITKDTSLVLLNQRSLQWTETLDGFIADSSSQVTFNVFEKHDVRKSNLLGTFIIPYDVLRSSRKEVLLSVESSKKKKTPSREIRVTWSESSVKTDNDNVRELYSDIESAKARMLKMNPAGLTVGISSVFNDVGQVVDTTENLAPSIDILAKCKVVSERLGFVVQAVEAIAEIHPYAKIAWSVISFIPMKISDQIQLDKDISDLLDEMAFALDLASDKDELRSRCEKSEPHKKTLTRLLEQISECGHFIQSYVKDVNFGKRLLKNFITDGKTVVENFRQALRKLREDFISDAIVTVATNVFHILAEVESIGKDIKEVDLNVKLQKLLYGQGTDFDPERGCLPQTRVKIIDEIIGWVNDPSSPQVLLLFGQAGTGKSSIAHEIARRFRSLDRLTTSYRFVRGEPSSHDCYRFFTTLARNLCKKYPAFRIALSTAITNNPDLVEMRAYSTLFESLLREPLKDICFVGPVLIVVDALDESEDASETRWCDTPVFYDFFAKHAGELPSNFRLLITSRPEVDLLDAFPESSSVRHMHMSDQSSEEVDNDILTYIRAKLSGTRVGKGDLLKLVKKAEGLFQWAAVACNYITRPPYGLNSELCIQRVLNPPANIKTGLNRLDQIYTTVLGRFDMDDPAVRDNFQSTMRQIIGSFEPLSIDALNTMRTTCPTNNLGDISDIVKGLGSLLSNVTPSESALPVAPLHTSFRDFLVDGTRSGVFCVNLDNVHGEFAMSTLRTMQKELRFNICELGTSYLLNREVLDLEQRIKNNISSALSYSCHFWAVHLAHVSEFDQDLLKYIKMLMEENFLYWLEVMSLSGTLALVSRGLVALRRWLGQMQDDILRGEGEYSLDALVQDAVDFVRTFGYPIVESAPHIYLSALPFAPSSSLIARFYSPRFPCTLGVKQGRWVEWPALVMSVSVPDDSIVLCVAWSRNDEYIAAGLWNSWKESVLVWNASTGMRVSGSFRDDDIDGHPSSIAFSRRGLWLASGFSGGSIRIWKLTTTRQEVVLEEQTQTLTGTAGAVLALAFSENGRQLISGSTDGNVRIWDLEREVVLAEFLGGHKNPVWAVSFSPDEEHILSRSGFRSARVWNVKTRQRVPFKEMEIPAGIIETTQYHIDSFQLLGKGLPNGSSFTPRSLAEAAECEEAYGPKGVRQYYSLVAAFSRDGKFVATYDGVTDGQLRVWHVNGKLAGKLVGSPLNDYGTHCLAFSEDGKRILSGSSGVVRIWNVGLVDSDEDRKGSSEREQPRSLVLSPDGKQIVVVLRKEVLVLDLSTRQKIVQIRETDESQWTRPKVAISMDGDLVAFEINHSDSDEIYITTFTGEAVAGPLKSDQITSVAFSAFSNDLLAFGDSGGNVSILNASTGAVIAGPQQICKSDVRRLALLPGGTRVGVADWNNISIWDTHTGVITGPFTHEWETPLVFSLDGLYINSHEFSIGDKYTPFKTLYYTLHIMDSTTGDMVRGPVEFSDDQKSYLDASYSYKARSISLMPGGQFRMAFEGKHHAILVFEVINKGDHGLDLQGPVVLGGHVGHVASMEFSRGGQFLTTMSESVIRIWDVQAAAQHKQTFADPDNAEIAYIGGAYIETDTGWMVCRSSQGGSPWHLMWIPTMLRNSLQLPLGVCVMNWSRERETSLDLENFVHGKDWVKCKATL